MAPRENHTPFRYRFDDVVVDRRNFRVLKNGKSRTLEPRIFDLLIFLIENRGRVLEKQELFEQVWKQAFVTDNALTRAIKEIRRATGDDAGAPRYIETIPKRGYRFIAEVTSSSDQQSRTPRPEELVAALNYRIQSKLGQGGGGVVYLAEDTRLKRTVVLKFLSEELTTNELGLRRFLREARLASSLDHPNICTIYEVNQVEGLDFIVMQYAEGKTLKQFIAGKPLEPRVTLSIAVQIADAVAAAHEQHVIHRDIKPGNIIVTNKGQVKILDFGLAKSLAYANRDNEADESELTRQGAQLGTPAYMSPEQARGEPADRRSDIFSFGVVLYEMTSGRVPFKARSQAETMNAVINTPHTPVGELNRKIPADLASVIDRALAKEPADRYQTISEMLADLNRIAANAGVAQSPAVARQPFDGRQGPARLTRRRMNAGVVIAALIATAAIWFFVRNANLKWAREQLPRIEQLAAEQKHFEAYDLAERASKYVPDDPTIARLMPTISDNITVTTEPPGAKVYIKRFSQDAKRQLIGSTPIHELRTARGEYVVYIEKDGYAPFQRTISGKMSRYGTTMTPPDEPTVVQVKMIESGNLPDRMTFVPGGRYNLVCWQKPTSEGANLADYFIDRYEVTNREYKEFVIAGGYQKKQYWKHAFSKNGQPLSWEEALSGFRDRTGLPGPRNWSGQSYPDGKADHPVTDITWYEAAAYAEFRGKKLPTIFQWEKAARNGQFTYSSGYVMPWGPIDVTSTVDTRANFKSGGTTPVGSFEFGMSPFGCYDMAGNASEWCANETSHGFITAGASWDDLSYMFAYVGEFPAFENSSKLGFRCVVTADSTTSDQGAMYIDTAGQVPVFSSSSEATFKMLLSHYRYDKTALDAQVLETTETDEWRREKISFLGSGDDRALAYLYLPKNTASPFQVLNFVPAGDVYGCYATMPEAIEMLLPPFIRSGRAVFAVVFSHFKERKPNADVWPSSASVKRREILVSDATDLSRGFDYLQTRGDIDSSRVAFFGYSAGANEGLFFSAVEPRYRSVVLLSGGMRQVRPDALPEVTFSNFAGHIRAPKLMLNGRYDEAHPFKLLAEPLFKLLSEPKQIIVYEGGHTPPIEIAVPAVNGFLDQTMGKVSRN
ncbi:MAG TPA: protein kinase [Blastocatellia bacterium]|nr:protein kinase [Blastocatellia bacterium]